MTEIPNQVKSAKDLNSRLFLLEPDTQSDEGVKWSHSPTEVVTEKTASEVGLIR